MDADALNALVAKITELKNSKQFDQCIQKLESCIRAECDPATLLVLNVAFATCSLQIGDTEGARRALKTVERSDLSNVERIYYDLPFADLLREEKDSKEAESVLRADLALPEIGQAEHSGALGELLGRLGIILAEAQDYENAVEKLQKALELVPYDDDEFRDSILLFMGYCHQSLGNLDAAEQEFRVLTREGGESAADGYYRCGGVYMERGNLEAALDMFKEAERHWFTSRIGLREILLAESDAYAAKGNVGMANEILDRVKELDRPN